MNLSGKSALEAPQRINNHASNNQIAPFTNQRTFNSTANSTVNQKPVADQQELHHNNATRMARASLSKEQPYSLKDNKNHLQQDNTSVMSEAKHKPKRPIQANEEGKNIDSQGLADNTTRVPTMRLAHYNPLQWPPDLTMADRHVRCSQPGRENPQGEECACCGRMERLPVTNWIKRNILNDFRASGGSASSYFLLNYYLTISILVMLIVCGAYQIYATFHVCTIQKYANLCTDSFKLVFFIEYKDLMDALIDLEKVSMVNTMEALHALGLVLLVGVTVAIKYFFARIYSSPADRSHQLFSRYSLLMKNIPPDYTTEMIRNDIAKLRPENPPVVVELVRLYPTRVVDNSFRKLFDLYFSILEKESRLLKVYPNLASSLSHQKKLALPPPPKPKLNEPTFRLSAWQRTTSQRGYMEAQAERQLRQEQSMPNQLFSYEHDYQNVFGLPPIVQWKKDQLNPTIMALYNSFIENYEKFSFELSLLTRHSSRTIVVFDSVADRDFVHMKLKSPPLKQLRYYFGRLLSISTSPAGQFTDQIAEPQQLLWRFMGQQSSHKMKVQIETSLMGVGFMLLCFVLLYFPIVKVDEEKALRPLIGSVLNILVSLLLQVLAIIYRQILIRLIPYRMPSSRRSQSYFIVMTTVTFHFFFYLVAPCTYYLVDTLVPRATKLKQLFTSVAVFVAMSLFVAILDARYRLYVRRKKRTLRNSFQYCQVRFHQELNPPSFPIEFKLMVVLNIWTFNAFYLFQIPFTMLLLIFALVFLYYMDKRNLYKHYRQTEFLSIEFMTNVQNTYLNLFLIGACTGYFLCSRHIWQYIFMGVVVILALIFNYLIGIWVARINLQKVSQPSADHKESNKHQQITDKNGKKNDKSNINQTQRGPEDNIEQLDLDQDDSRIESQKLNAVINKALNNASIKKQMVNSLKQSILVTNEQDTSLSGGLICFGYEDSYSNYLSQFRNKSVNDLLFKKNKQILKTLNQEMPRTNSEMQHIGRNNLKETLWKSTTQQP